jgi:prepilin-type N-terminal cleavage/methylation domain-containing protein
MQGFSLVEVMVSVLLLSLGLLGNLSLQTYLIKQTAYTASRIAANNLVAELQGVALADYGNIASYAVAATEEPDCSQASLSSAAYPVQWQCRARSIGGASSYPVVTWNSVSKVLEVTVNWSFANDKDALSHKAFLSTVVDTVL